MNKLRVGLSHMCVWILGAIIWSTAHPLPAIGQSAPLDLSLDNEQAQAGQAEREGPEEAPKALPKKRRFLSRFGPQQLTPEQEAEAIRLRQVAARYGTDPTALVGRIQLSSAYYGLSQQARSADSVARVDMPFRGNYILRVDFPYVKYVDPNRAATTSITGVSDIAVSAGWRIYNTPGYAVLLGVISTMPTATETEIGLGKYTVGPTIATARVLPEWNTFLIGLLTHQLSVAGDPARKDFQVTRVILGATKLWKANWWNTIQTVWAMDWERNRKNGLIVEFEFGKNLLGPVGVFVRPGVGVFGQGVGGTYDWNVEVGIRRTFKSF